MSLGTYTHISASQTVGLRTVIFSLRLTSGATHRVTGSTLDLSAATRGAYRGFHSRVDGVEFLGWITTTSINEGTQPTYIRAASGAPATGRIRCYQTGIAQSPFDAVTAAEDLSTMHGLFAARGV